MARDTVNKVYVFELRSTQEITAADEEEARSKLDLDFDSYLDFELIDVREP